MAPPIITQAQLDAQTAIKVTGTVSSEDMAAVSRQLYALTEWAAYLNEFDLTGLPQPNGPATNRPPPPPPWP